MILHNFISPCNSKQRLSSCQGYSPIHYTFKPARRTCGEQIAHKRVEEMQLVTQRKYRGEGTGKSLHKNNHDNNKGKYYR